MRLFWSRLRILCWSLPLLLVAAKPQAAPSGGLSFDGINDYVTFGNAAGLGLTNFTLETWFFWTGGGTWAGSGSGGINAIPLIAKGRGESDGNNRDANYFFGISTNSHVLAADFEEGANGSSPGLNHPVYGATTVTSNVWHHAALTFDGNTWRVYLDGNLDAELAVGRWPRWDSIQHASLGTALTSTGVAEGAFAGILDEARIWDYARTGADIANNFRLPIMTAPGLVGRWSMDEGTGTVVSDTSGKNHTGTLVNGVIWTTGYPFNTGPLIAGQWPPAYASLTNLTQIQVTFSEPVVGVDAEDLLINSRPALSVSGTGAGYTFYVAPPMFGLVRIGWVAAHGIANSAGKTFDATITGAAWNYLVEPPRQTLVATNAVWRFLPGRSEASSPMNAWRLPAFDDTPWGEGPAPFYYDRGGTPAPFYGNTVLTDMYNGYTTLYLRHRFHIANPAMFTNMVLKSQCDDGFIAWINGIEVFRSPTVGQGEIAYNVDSGSASEPLTFVYQTIPTPAEVLVAGDNLLAVQALNDELSSSDFMIDLELYASVQDPSFLPPTIAAVFPPSGEVLELTALTVTFTEAVRNVNAADLLVNGTPATGLTGGSNTWRFAFPRPAFGPVQITWAANHGITDLDTPARAFDQTAPSARFQYTLVNSNAPIIAAQIPMAGATLQNTLSQVQVTFNKPVQGVQASDLLINGAAATGLAGAGAVYTFTFPQPLYGPVVLSWAANHGIADLGTPANAFDATRSGASWQYLLVDQFPPAILDQYPPAGANVTNLTAIEILFSKPVSGVDAGDLLINGIPAMSVSGAEDIYTFTFARQNTTALRVSWAANHGIKDQAGVPNAFDANAAGASWIYRTPDTVAPAIAGIEPAPGATVRSLTRVVVTFNEPVSGVTPDDLRLNNVAAQTVSGTGAGPYTFQFSAPATGSVAVAWSTGHGIGDFASPPNPFTGSSWNYDLDPNAHFQDAVVINEIMYHPRSENIQEEYIELHNLTGQAVNLTGWQLVRGVDFVFPNVRLAPEGYLVVAANLPAFQAKYPGVTNVVGGWRGLLSNGGEDIELEDAAGELVDRVEYADEGDWALRQRGPVDNGARGWEWYKEHDGVSVNTATGQTVGGKSLELVNPGMPNDNGQNWLASIPENGTPGQANSVLQANIAPLISDVVHQPLVPKPTDPVAIIARIQDEQMPEMAAKVYFRNHTSTAPAAFASTNLWDDGLHGDGLAGDGILAAVLPPFPNGTVIEFYVEAVDTDNNRRTWPAAARLENGTFTQAANALYQVDDNLSPASPPNARQPFYRVILTGTERVEFQNINRNSDAEMNATWITQDASETTVRYNCGIRIRGAGTRGRTPTNYRVNIPTDRKWKGLTEANFNSQFVHLQLMGSALAAEVGLPAAEARVVQLRLNGQNQALSDRPSGSQGSGFGTYIYVESLNADWAERAMPLNSGGNVYRASIYPWIANLKFLNTTNAATWMANGYSKTSNQSENDWRDLNELTRALSSGLPETEYLEAVRTNANVTLFLRYFALCAILDYHETSMCRGAGDDYAMYRGGVDRLFQLVPHDFDTIFDLGDTSEGNPNHSIWEAVDSPATTDPNQQALFLLRFMRHPEFAPVYLNELKRMLETAFSADNFDSLVEQLLGGWVPEDLRNQIKSFMVTRRASVWSQLPLTFSVNVPLSVTNDYYLAGTASVRLTGRANGLETKTVRVNGFDASFSRWQGQWTNTVALAPGLNRVLVQALDAAGTELVRTNVDIWYDDASLADVSGVLSGNPVWTAIGGPYRVTGNVTVPTGATLMIQPGTTVYLAAGVNFTVNGRLLAEGTEARPIRFSRQPGATGSWRQLLFEGATQTQRLTHVVMEFGGADGAANIRSVNSTLFLDHILWTNTTSQLLDLNNSSITLTHSVLPTIQNNELLHFSTMPANGQALIQSNIFGTTSGYNDVIDFTGGNRPGPIVQFLDNLFTGGVDDVLDLDSTDAHIEGNIFMHVHQDASRDSAGHAISTGQDFADTSELWIARNIFFDVDHAVLLKQGASAVMQNNTIAHIRTNSPSAAPASVVNFGEPNRNAAGGAGARLEGNIIWDIDSNRLYLNYTNGVMTWTLNQSLVSGTNHPGAGNLNLEPHFANYVPANITAANIRQALSLRPGSPAIGTGPNGLDMGALVPGGATISGEPSPLTSANNAVLTVGGPGITHYRFRVNASAWSAETPVANPIVLTGLNAGDYTVRVVGKNSAGVWQTGETVSQTWGVAPGAVDVVLNEILASNDGAVRHAQTSPDCIELFNPGYQTVNLSGLRLTDDPATPNKFVFPAGATLAGRSYLVVYANNPDGTPGYHLGFSLQQEGESVYLFDALDRGGRLLDAVAFGPQLVNQSIGRLAAGRWGLTLPTLGAANLPAPVADPSRLRINEWLAISQSASVDDFIELFNPSPSPAALGGLHLTDNPFNWPDRHEIAPLSFVPANSYVAFRADGDSTQGPTHLNFRLGGQQGLIGLYDAALNLIDYVYYEPQQLDISQGRSPNGSTNIVAFNQPTPGAPNPLASTIGTNVTNIELLFIPPTNSWSYNQTQDLSGSNWFAESFNTSGWLSGPGVHAFEDNTNIVPWISTVLANPQTAAPGLPAPRVYYFRNTFEVTTNLAGFTVFISLIIDDGAVIYLNGEELGRVRMAAGPVTYATLATNTPTGGDATSEDLIIVPVERLKPGQNLLAAEVHQASAGSSDIVWGVAMVGIKSITNIVGNSAVVLNEVLANNSSLREPTGGTPDWVELYNQSGNPVDLSGFSLSDNPGERRRWVFPAGTILGAAAYLRVLCDADRPASTHGGEILNTGFGLQAAGGSVYLFDADPASAPLNSVTYGLQAADFSIGRVPNGFGPWELTIPTAGGANLQAALGNALLLKVNEWMPKPASGEDWFELYNPSAQPVAIGNFYLTDDLTSRLKSRIPALSFIGASTNGYQQFIADDSSGGQADHVNFKLDGTREAIGLSTPAGVLIDGISYLNPPTGVSEGRFPDGATNLVRFPGTASPGDANYRLLTEVVIHEVLSHTDPPLEDAIELRNQTAAAVDISGWWLSDAQGALQKYRIPDGTVLPPYGFHVFYEYQFNPDPTDALSFALSSTAGDQVYLSAANSEGLTGYRASVRFGAAEKGVSFGRYVTSAGEEHFVSLTARTFGVDNPDTVAEFRAGAGLSNAAPRVGPVVISEIMYHPVETGTNDNVLEEFIELYNLSNQPVPLYDPTVYRDTNGVIYANGATNTWRLRDAVDFEFPANTIIPPNDYLLVVSFDPAVDANALAAFRAKHPLNPAAKLVGPYRGKLANNSDSLELEKPDAPDTGAVPYVLVERIQYADTAPWPAGADGTGPSLQRVDLRAYGNDPINWIAAPPTPGPALVADSDRDGLPDEWETANGLNPLSALDAAQDPDGDGLTNLQEYQAGTDPHSAASTLVLLITRPGSVVLQFNAAAGKSYTVEYSETLQPGPWPGRIQIPAGPARPVQISDPATANARFFRLRTP